MTGALLLCHFVNVIANILMLNQEDGSESEPNELGRIVAKLPMPPGCMSTLFKEINLAVVLSMSYIIIDLKNDEGTN